MAIGANSYGSTDEVGALTPLYATATGVIYSTTTRPTLAQVEKFVDRVSGILNVLLAEAGFKVPVSQADAKLALDEFVVAQVVELCHAANGAGPYAPGSEEMRAGSPFRTIEREAAEFIGKHAAGFAALGATRSRVLAYGLQCRTEDDGGDGIVPIFQRKMMGNEIVDWDTG